MNTKFVLRGLLFALVVLGLIIAALAVVLSGFLAGPPAGPAPPPASLSAPRGEMPSAPVGMGEWAKYGDEEFKLAGSGFFFELDNGVAIAATTAHSLSIGDANRPLERVAFGIAGQSGFLLEMDSLFGDPGVPRLGRDMTVDYVLLKVGGTIDPSHVLQPDPRGGSEPGERLILYSGIGDEDGGIRMLPGTVHTVSKNGIWVLMDDEFHMSTLPSCQSNSGR